MEQLQNQYNVTLKRTNNIILHNASIEPVQSTYDDVTYKVSKKGSIVFEIWGAKNSTSKITNVEIIPSKVSEKTINIAMYNAHWYGICDFKTQEIQNIDMVDEYGNTQQKIKVSLNEIDDNLTIIFHSQPITAINNTTQGMSSITNLPYYLNKREHEFEHSSTISVNDLANLDWQIRREDVSSPNHNLGVCFSAIIYPKEYNFSYYDKRKVCVYMTYQDFLKAFEIDIDAYTQAIQKASYNLGMLATTRATSNLETAVEHILYDFLHNSFRNMYWFEPDLLKHYILKNTNIVHQLEQKVNDAIKDMSTRQIEGVSHYMISLYID